MRGARGRGCSRICRNSPRTLHSLRSRSGNLVGRSLYQTLEGKVEGELRTHYTGWIGLRSVPKTLADGYFSAETLISTIPGL